MDFVLQSAVLLLFILATGYGFHAEALVLYPLSFVTLVVFTTALTFWVSALNVRYRDVQHLINLALLVWFWMTPIVYPGVRPGAAHEPRHDQAGHAVERLPAEPADADHLGVPARALRRRQPGGDRVLPDVTVGWLAGRARSAVHPRVLDPSAGLHVAAVLPPLGDFAEEL